jgi:hypothetical protein
VNPASLNISKAFYLSHISPNPAPFCEREPDMQCKKDIVYIKEPNGGLIFLARSVDDNISHIKNTPLLFK